MKVFIFLLNFKNPNFSSFITTTTYPWPKYVSSKPISNIAQIKPTQIYVSTIKDNDTRHLRKP